MVKAKDKLNTLNLLSQKELRRLKVAFVGAFASKANDGTVGGQMYACRSLIESPLSSQVEWQLIDSTMRSLPPPNVGIRSYYALRRISRLFTLLIFGKVDTILIFTSYDFSSFFEKGIMSLIGRAFGVKVTLSIRSEVKRNRGDAWFNFFRRLVLANVQTVICQSEAARRALVGQLNAPTKKLLVVYNWIDHSKYTSAKLSCKNNNARKTFIYLGWLETYKGVYDLLKAIKIISDKGHSFRVLICGGGREAKAMVDEAKKNGLEEFIEFRGWVTDDEKIRALGESDIFVLPSYSEGVPNALLESMASGLAIIATPVGGVGAIIDPGVNGLLVKPGDAVGLANAMEYFMVNPEKSVEMGKANFEKILQKHDISQVWRQVANALGVSGEGGW